MMTGVKEIVTNDPAADEQYAKVTGLAREAYGCITCLPALFCYWHDRWCYGRLYSVLF